MKSLFAFLLLCSLAMLAVLGMQAAEGQVLIFIGGFRFTIPLSVFIVMFMLSGLLWYILLVFIGHLSGLPKQWRARQHRLKQAKGYYSLLQAQLALAEGRWSKAGAFAEDAWKSNDEPVLAGLIAAQSYHELGDFKKRDDWLVATESMPIAERARSMMLARMCLDSLQSERAISILNELLQKGARQIAVLRLLLQAHHQRGHEEDFAEILRLTRHLEKHEAILPAVAKQMKMRAHENLLKSDKMDVHGLHVYWKSLKNNEKFDNELIVMIVNRALVLGDADFAGMCIERALEECWCSNLAGLYGYGQMTVRQLKQRIERAERWLGKYPSDASLLLTLGQLCLQSKLWGKAQNYIEAAVAIEPNKANLLELAKLFEELGRHEDAGACYRRVALS